LQLRGKLLFAPLFSLGFNGGKLFSSGAIVDDHAALLAKDHVGVEPSRFPGVKRAQPSDGFAPV
jgi:hypothetical protein